MGRVGPGATRPGMTILTVWPAWSRRYRVLLRCRFAYVEVQFLWSSGAHCTGLQRIFPTTFQHIVIVSFAFSSANISNH